MLLVPTLMVPAAPPELVDVPPPDDAAEVPVPVEAPALLEASELLAAPELAEPLEPQAASVTVTAATAAPTAANRLTFCISPRLSVRANCRSW